MLKKSQVLSTVQQVKLQKLALDIEALRKEVQKQSNVGENSLQEANSNTINCNLNTEIFSHQT